MLLDLEERKLTNFHIAMNGVFNASRILKETQSIVQFGVADKVIIVGLLQDDLQQKEVLDQSRKIVRIKLRTRNWPKNIFFQIIKYIEFVFAVLWMVVAQKAGIINVHSVALLPLGCVAKILVRGRLVYDAHELETETAGLRGVRKRGAKIIERALVKFCDLVIVVSPSIERWYRESYNIVNVVTIGNMPRYRRGEPSDIIRDRLRIPFGKRILIYQGGFSRGRGIEELVAAAPALNDIGYVVVFMGFGRLQSFIEDSAKSASNIYFLPSVNSDEVLKFTASADIGVSSLSNAGLNHQYALPNKLFEYVMAGVPVIVSNLKEMSAFVHENRVGVSVDSWSPSSIVAAVSEIDAMRGPELQERLRLVGKESSWESQEPKLVKAYDDYVKRPVT
ncbi:MAG TPA: glycosyltransferase [Devosiaceae bacterium]